MLCWISAIQETALQPPRESYCARSEGATLCDANPGRKRLKSFGADAKSALRRRIDAARSGTRARSASVARHGSPACSDSSSHASSAEVSARSSSPRRWASSAILRASPPAPLASISASSIRRRRS